MESVPYNKRLHYFAIFLTVWTFFVVTLGGVVKSNEAGLTIAEGFILEWLPNWWHRPGLRLEFLHRMFVGGLGVGVLALTLLTLKYDPRGRVKRFSVVLLFLVYLQAVLGYLTVTFLAHWHTSIPHVALGHAFLACMAAFTTMLSPAWTSSMPAVDETGRRPLEGMAKALMIAVFVQLLLGAAIRHDDKGHYLLLEEDHHFYWHLSAHVIGALAALHYLARMLIRVLGVHRDVAQLAAPARAIMILVGFQLLLGPAAAVLKIMYSRDEEFTRDPPLIRSAVATTHVIFGALILALSAVLYARAKRFCASKIPQSPAEKSPAPIQGASA